MEAAGVFSSAGSRELVPASCGISAGVNRRGRAGSSAAAQASASRQNSSFFIGGILSGRKILAVQGKVAEKLPASGKLRAGKCIFS